MPSWPILGCNASTARSSSRHPRTSTSASRERPTAGDALRPILEAAAGPEQRIVQVSDDEFGLATDGRIILITRARQTRPGEWHFVDEFFCSDP
jgi:hypothetical protein